jgi:hypothetical protein
MYVIYISGWMDVLEDYLKVSTLPWIVGVKFGIFFINAFPIVEYTKLSAGCILTWSLNRAFTRFYLLLFHYVTQLEVLYLLHLI